MRYRYYIVDVFTEQPFGGNQLAVLPDARGLSDTAMQKVAREFNFSETTFVLPPADPANTRNVRIFTPQAEIPFAGHPNVGTAYALVAVGEVKTEGASDTLRFEDKAGLVTVSVTSAHGQPVHAELTAPQPPQLGASLQGAAVAQALALPETDIVIARHMPRIASAGLPFLCIELRDRYALARSRVMLDKAEKLLPRDTAAGFLLYTFDGGAQDVDIRARMYAPLHGVAEDPATGSAAAALAGLLAQLHGEAAATLHWRIAQGIEMGRPSLLEATAVKENGVVTAIRVGGAAVMVSEGWIEVPDDG